MQEARLAGDKMHGKLACGRPLVVPLVSERTAAEIAENSSKAGGLARRSITSRSSDGQMSESTKIAAAKNRVKAALQDECGTREKKRKLIHLETAFRKMDDIGGIIQ